MQITNFHNFKTHLKAKLDSVSQDNDIVIVNLQKDENVVLISLREYNSIQETLHLFSSSKNCQRLTSAIEGDKKQIHQPPQNVISNLWC
jgi:antitoxin YefM